MLLTFMRETSYIILRIIHFGSVIWIFLRKIQVLIYNEPIKQDKNLKKISDLDIIRIRTKNGGQRIWEKEQHTRQSIKAK